MDFYRKEVHGEVLWACYRAGSYTVSVSMLYVVIAAVCICMAWGLIWLVPALAVTLFCLWRIQRVHAPVVLVCKKALLVAGAPEGGGLKAIFETQYMAIEYDDIAGVSDDWSELYVGERMTGGLVKVPVRMRWVSREDKARFQDWIDRMQRDNDG